jgi:hypothetical protein
MPTVSVSNNGETIIVAAIALSEHEWQQLVSTLGSTPELADIRDTVIEYLKNQGVEIH